MLQQFLPGVHYAWMASIPQLISVGTRHWEMPAGQAKEESLRYIYISTSDLRVFKLILFRVKVYHRSCPRVIVEIRGTRRSRMIRRAESRWDLQWTAQRPGSEGHDALRVLYLVTHKLLAYKSLEHAEGWHTYRSPTSSQM